MALVKGTNSYVSLAESDAYFEDRVDSVWDDHEDEHEAALVTATLTIDQSSWLGQSDSADQALAFPRKMLYFDPKLGRHIRLLGTETEAPTRVKVAVYELAHHYLRETEVLRSKDTYRSLSTPEFSQVGIKQKAKIPAHVRNMILPLMDTGVTAIRVNF